MAEPGDKSAGLLCEQLLEQPPCDARGLRRSTLPPPPENDYLRQLVTYFLGLTALGRGDSARGRSVQVLYFLNFVWSSPAMPLYGYRPHRNLVAFLAMTFDLLTDLIYGHTEAVLEGRTQAADRSLERCLGFSWSEFCHALSEARLARFADVLDEVVRSVVRNPAYSELPAELKRLGVYMTSSQLAQFDRGAFFDQLPLHRLFASLRFEPPGLWQARSEQHPVGGDLRAAIREGYDALWASAAARISEPDLTDLFAALPVDSLALFAKTYAFQDEDFAVYYARLTDSRRPGRTWRPAPDYAGFGPEERQHFTFLTAGDERDAYARKAQMLTRIGLSSTFPQTLRLFDGWLEAIDRFPELHTRAPWQRSLARHQAEITRKRRLFFEQLVQLAKARRGDR